MILLPESSFPVPFSPTWRSLDSTKLKEYMRCPRRFFYSYVLGWRPESKDESLHLVFGSAWHVAMEHLLKGMKEHQGYSPQLLQEAYNRLSEYFNEAFPDVELHDSMAPKNPTNALQGLIEYANRYTNDWKDFDVKYTEITGTVPLSDDRRLVFKIDAVCEDKETGLAFVLEHKTSQQMTSNWADQWTLSVQTGTYCHALYCLMSSDKVYGARVNGAFFRKKGNDFLRVPIRQTPESMQRWLDNTNKWYDEIEQDFELLTDDTPEANMMNSFKMNTEACMDWGRTCLFHDFCMSCNNPIRIAQEPPIGFEVRHWNPLEEHLKTATLINVEGE